MAISARRSPGLKLAIAAGFAAAAALALAGAVQAAAADGSSALAALPNPFDMPVHVISVGDRLPRATYLDQDGESLAPSQLAGKTVIIGFVYTNCNDQCPILTDKFARLAADLPADRFELLEISIDPARDSVAAIANFARVHGIAARNWRVLTGSAALVDSFAKPLGVSVVEGSAGQLLHNERTVIVGPDGRVADFIDDAGWTPLQIAAAARYADGMPSSSLARLDLALGKAVQAVCGGTTAARSGLADLAGVVGVLLVGGLVALFLGRRLFASAS